MRIIDATNAADYLRERGHFAFGDGLEVHELSGGVSNVVLHVCNLRTQDSLVLKQVRRQLRVADPWFSSIERIWREVDVLELCREALAMTGTGWGKDDAFTFSVPRVLFRDRENYLYGMSAAPPHHVWKEKLLAGETNPAIAAACGAMMGQLHAATWNSPEVESRVGDTLFFDQLRIDPYYRHMVRQGYETALLVQGVIDSLAEHRHCLVHGDFSPKNLLVHCHGLTLIDFEVGHYGDPAFDIGFFLSHLVLKAVRARENCPHYVRLTREFWHTYAGRLQAAAGDGEFQRLVQRGIRNCAACCLARIDGKSKVNYLDPQAQEYVRRVAGDLLASEPADWAGALAILWP